MFRFVTTCFDLISPPYFQNEELCEKYFFKSEIILFFIICFVIFVDVFLVKMLKSEEYVFSFYLIEKVFLIAYLFSQFPNKEKNNK